MSFHSMQFPENWCHFRCRSIGALANVLFLPGVAGPRMETMIKTQTYDIHINTNTYTHKLCIDADTHICIYIYIYIQYISIHNIYIYTYCGT